MKTRELIRRLQQADPSGDLEVCVNNCDIHFVARQPAYYDGCFQVLKRDPELTDCYNIKGVEIRSHGDKIRIRTLSVKDAIWNDADVPVTYDDGVHLQDWEPYIADPNEPDGAHPIIAALADILRVRVGEEEAERRMLIALNYWFGRCGKRTSQSRTARVSGSKSLGTLDSKNAPATRGCWPVQ